MSATRYTSSAVRLLLMAAIACTIQSCKKKDDINNDGILKKPFSLYAGAQNGSLYLVNSVDTGSLMFPIDGAAVSALLTTGTNVLMAKQNLFISQNNGRNFSLAYDKMYSIFQGFPIYVPGQAAMLDAKGYDRVYLCSIEGRGIVYSQDNGKTWTPDAGWDNGVSGGGISSLAQTKGGAVFAHNIFTDSIYRKDNRDDNWTWVQPGNGLPSSGGFMLSNYNNVLLAVDVTGINGILYSADGANWSPYTGLPNRPIYAATAPFDQRLLVGTDSMGIYRLEGSVFVPANNGLETGTTVYGFAGKDDIFKNETRRAFIYAATNKGLYRSQDGGLNWVRVKTGKFTSIY